jgi:tRNA(fMet)-specific endonuclease VapC
VIILDTDCFTLAQHGSNTEGRTLGERILRESKDDIGVTIITFEEQMRGWLAFVAKARNEENRILAYGRLLEMLGDFAKVRVLAYDQEASFHYLRLMKARLRIGTMDLKIGAIALANSATLITRNMRDFEKIVGLKIEDWTRD